jgi:hypothetical protein
MEKMNLLNEDDCISHEKINEKIVKARKSLLDVQKSINEHFKEETEYKLLDAKITIFLSEILKTIEYDFPKNITQHYSNQRKRYERNKEDIEAKGQILPELTEEQIEGENRLQEVMRHVDEWEGVPTQEELNQVKSEHEKKEEDESME